MRKASPAKPKASALPSREEVIAFIGGQSAPSRERAPARVTKRDIARAFGVKGEAKAELKLLIKDLQEEGALARGRKSLQVEGRLPTLVVADIAELDRNGELIAKPAEWSEDAPPPRILVRRSRAKRDRSPAPGLGARVLMRVEFDSRRRSDGARLFGPCDQDARQGQGARLRGLSRSGRRFGPRASGREARRGARVFHTRRHGRRSAGRRPRRRRTPARGPLYPPFRARRRDDRLGQIGACSQPHRACDAPYPARVFPCRAQRGRGRPARPARCPARGLARASARHHRSARRQGPRRCGPRRPRFRPGEPGRIRCDGRDRRRGGLCPPRLGARSRGAGARKLGLFPRPGRADAAGTHFQRPLLAARDAKIGRRSLCEWSSARTGASARIRFTAS